MTDPIPSPRSPQPPLAGTLAPNPDGGDYAVWRSPQPDPLNFASVTRQTGPWHRAPESMAEGDPPHRRLWTDSRAQLDLIYADRERTVPVAANDYDGCYAVLTPIPSPDTDLRAAIKADLTALAHWSPEDWQERGRGADPIARTINAARDIVDARFGESARGR